MHDMVHRVLHACVLALLLQAEGVVRRWAGVGGKGDGEMMEAGQRSTAAVLGG